VKGAALQQGLLEQLEAHPDATREEHCQLWFKRTGIKVSTASISRARMALGWTRKKTLNGKENLTAGVA
jgi:transposase